MSNVIKEEFEKTFQKSKDNFTKLGEEEILKYMDVWKEFFYGFFIAGFGIATFKCNEAIESALTAVERVNKNIKEGKDPDDDIEVI